MNPFFCARPKRTALNDWCEAVEEFIASEMPEGTTYSLEIRGNEDLTRVTLKLEGAKVCADVVHGWETFQRVMFAVREMLMQRMLP